MEDEDEGRLGDCLGLLFFVALSKAKRVGGGAVRSSALGSDADVPPL